WWEAERTINRNSEMALNDGETFMRLASDYAYRADSLTLFGSYPLEEAQQLVNGLCGVPAERANPVAHYAGRRLSLKPNMQLTEGLYYFQGLIRKTRRVVNRETGQYLDLHPAEDVLLRALNGQNTLNDLNAIVSQIQSRPQRMPVRNG